MTFDFVPEKGFVKGRSPDINLKIGVAQLTPELSLELIEIVSGEPFHKDFLEQHGEGVQHLGFLTGEYDQVLKRAENLGIEVLMWAETDVTGMGHVRGAYLDTYDLIGVLVEIIEIKPLK
jgi:methylmalonyl-CoA/ethylmalonyl-CoA epimerase